MLNAYWGKIFHILKKQCHVISTSGFFHKSVSPKPLNKPIVPFRFFFENSQRYAHCAAQGAPPVSLTPVANVKNLQSEKFLFRARFVV